MASVNVNRNLTDQFYRYKMPKLVAKVEGKGNGIKTVIVNMVEIAKALNRPPMYPTKYFGCVLGAQVNCDNKNERYIVNGSHDAAKLQDYLDGFIKRYVLCSHCYNPETTLSVNQKKGIISLTCKACGHTGTINSQDKLTTYIIKCPPTQPSTPGASVSKRKKKEKDSTGKKNGDNSNSQQDSGEENDNEQNGDDDDDGDWCENPEIVGADDLTGGAQKLTINSDMDKPIKERMQIFYDFLKDKLSNHPQPDAALQKEIVLESERLDMKEKATIVLCEFLFTNPSKIMEVIKSNKSLFLRFTFNNSKSQKYLLRGFEGTCEKYRNELLPRVALILKTFYDEDILEEKVLIEWYDKKKCSVKELGPQIFEKSKKFIDWLKEAEEEEDDEEDDSDDDNNKEEDDGLQVVYDERTRPDKIMEIAEEKTVS